MIKGLVKHSHSIGQNAFHFVWKLKYAKDPFKFPILRKDCEQFLRKIAEENNMEIFKIRVNADHIHIFVGLPPNMSVSKALQLLKGGSAYRLFRQHPWLRKHFRKGHLWSPGKFFRSVGNVTAKTIEHYIAQSQGEWKKVPEFDETTPDVSQMNDTSQATLRDFMD